MYDDGRNGSPARAAGTLRRLVGRSEPVSEAPCPLRADTA